MRADGLVGFGHRVVHGGPDLDAPVVVDAPTLARIAALEPLAPLHNPPAVAVLKALAARFPRLPQVACFDTAFHRGHPAVADRFAIPEDLYREGVRRYGFHGLSYEYIAGALAEQAPRDLARSRRGGASRFRCVDVRFGRWAQRGFLHGVHGSARIADGDATGFAGRRRDPLAAAAEGLERRSDRALPVRRLRPEGAVRRFERHAHAAGSEAPLARLAVEYFVYHVVCTVGALAAGMGGIDGLVFTAGIGERSAEIRARVLRRLGWLGFSLDEAANQADGPLLTHAHSERPAYVIPTDEEVVIARHTLALIGGA